MFPWKSETSKINENGHILLALESQNRTAKILALFMHVYLAHQMLTILVALHRN